MNIPPSEAKKLSNYEFQAILWNWNENESLDSSDVGPPDADQWATMRDKINADPRLTGPAPAKATVN